MKRLYLAKLFLVLLLSGCRASLPLSLPALTIFPTANPHLLGVKSADFRGTIFTDSATKEFGPTTPPPSPRFTPSREDIQACEILLASQLQQANTPRLNQGGNNPILEKCLSHYFRQYVGFLDKRGSRIIHINFYWDEYSQADKLKGYADQRLTYDSPYALVFDGGSYYWQVNVNLTTRLLSDLQVNGEG
jgi:hypothetical protein